MKFSLDPVVDAYSQVLILGTMPGDESLRLGQYYANPRNQFWEIVSAVYEETIEADYSAKLEFLHRNRLAIWDVLHHAVREGSSDQKILSGIPNEFALIFRTFPSIRIVAFNGAKAEKYFYRLVIPHQFPDLGKTIKLISLPSTSPANAACTLGQKLERWKKIKTILG